jgi:transposase InsO family protein
VHSDCIGKARASFIEKTDQLSDKKAKLVARKRAKWHPVTSRQALKNRVEPNLLQQDFTASAPNQKWVTDITYFVRVGFVSVPVP